MVSHSPLFCSCWSHPRVSPQPGLGRLSGAGSPIAWVLPPHSTPGTLLLDLSGVDLPLLFQSLERKTGGLPGGGCGAGGVRWRRKRPAASLCTLGWGLGAGDYPRLGFVMICSGINAPKLSFHFLCLWDRAWLPLAWLWASSGQCPRPPAWELTYRMASFRSLPVSHAFCSSGGDLGAPEVCGFLNQAHLAVPVLPPTSCVTSGESPHLLEPWFPNG